MITPGQVEEWIREIQERPESAAMIIRQISKRLGELVKNNEQLLVENISLRSGERVEEYESRIANLEYQLEILKRQLGGLPAAQEGLDSFSMLVFDATGQILRLLLDVDTLVSGETIASFLDLSQATQESLQILVINSKEELLCVFDSGRAVTMPAAEIPPVEGEVLDWENAILQEPRGGENLVTILPIAKMALFGYCVQVSRRGYVKKIRESFLESYVASGNVGTGVVSPQDKTFGLALCNEEDLLVMVSKEGSLASLPVVRLPFTIQEAFRLNPSDHVVAAFVIGDKPSFLAVTQNGMVFHRETDWLAPDDSGKPKSRAILSKARMESGMRITGSAAVGESDWTIALTSDGELTIYEADKMLSAGSLFDRGSKLEVLSFTAFSP